MLRTVKTPGFARVTSKSADQLQRLMQDLYAHENIPWPGEVVQAAVRELLDGADRGSAWLIEIENETVGYFVLTMAFSLEFGGKFGLLDELYIRPEWTGSGIGSVTLAFVEEQCRAMGANVLRLEAGVGNEGALRFYERHGLRRESRYLMTKRLV